MMENDGFCKVCGIEEGQHHDQMGYSWYEENLYMGCCSKECCRTYMLIRVQIMLSDKDLSPSQVDSMAHYVVTGSLPPA